MEKETAMTLSPPAQAVLDAFTEDNSLHDWKHNHYNTEALAAALRAVAEQMCYARGPGMVVDVDDLLSIATELEAQ